MTAPIHVMTKGNKNNKPLVLLHGLCWTGSIWERIAEELKDHFYVIIPDLPGHGNSQRSVDYSFEEVSRQLHEAILSLETGERIAIAGSSIGASIALVYATLYNHVDHLVLVDGGYFPFSHTQGLTWQDIEEDEGLPDHIFENKANFIEYMKGGEPSLWNDEIERAALDQISWNEQKGRYELKISEADQIQYLKSEWDLNPLEKVKSLRDSLYIQLLVALNQDSDSELALKYANLFKQGHDNSKVTIFEETDHLIMLDKPSECIDLIKNSPAERGRLLS
jgi:pimeloyl-ACP methyl ester carboxylesterase